MIPGYTWVPLFMMPFYKSAKLETSMCNSDVPLLCFPWAGALAVQNGERLCDLQSDHMAVVQRS